METSICLLRMEFSIDISISIIYHCYKVEALPLLFYPSGQVVINMVFLNSIILSFSLLIISDGEDVKLSPPYGRWSFKDDLILNVTFQNSNHRKRYLLEKLKHICDIKG
jgi:hypothetical protein